MDTVEGILGDQTELQCSYENSTADITWRDENGTVIEGSVDGYNITLQQNEANNTVISTLIISQLEDFDFETVYTCSVDGTYVNGTLKIVKKSNVLIIYTFVKVTR